MAALEDLVRTFLKVLPARAAEGANLWIAFEDGDANALPRLERLLHTVKGEAHLLSLEEIGDHIERLEDLVARIHATGRRNDHISTVVLESFELLKVFSEGGNHAEIARVTAALLAAREG